MFFRTKEQASQWVSDLGLDAVALSGECVDRLAPNSIRIALAESRVSEYVVAKAIATAIGDVPEMCLWITEYGIWPSTENWHLYYALRRTYGDMRRLGELPLTNFSAMREQTSSRSSNSRFFSDGAATSSQPHLGYPSIFPTMAG